MTPAQPFLTNLHTKLASGTFVSDAGSFIVPLKTILMIETVGIDLQIPADQQVVSATLSISIGPEQTSFPIPMQPMGTIRRPGAAAETHYSGLHAVRIPAAGGAEVAFTIGRNSEVGNPVATCSLAGSLYEVG